MRKATKPAAIAPVAPSVEVPPVVPTATKRYTIQQKETVGGKIRWTTVTSNDKDVSRDTEQLIKMALGALVKKHPTAEFRVKDGAKVIELSKPEPKVKETPAKPELVLPTYDKADPKRLPFYVTEKGIVWNGKPTLDTVKSAKDALNTTQIGLGFGQADTIRELVDVHKMEVSVVAQMFVTSTGGKMTVAYAKSLLRMSRSVPMANRNPALTVTHHVAVKDSPQDQQVRLLAIAERDNLSVTGFTNAIRAEQPRKTSGQGSGGGRRPSAPHAPAERAATGVTSDTQGRHTAQPINTEGTGSNAVKDLIVQERFENAIRDLANSKGVTAQELLNKMLADSIGREQRELDKLGANTTVAPKAPQNDAQKQKTANTAPVAPSLPIDDYDEPADQVTADEMPELPVNADTVSEAMTLDVNATAETVAFRLNTTVDKVIPYMPVQTVYSTPPVVQKVGSRRK